MLSVGGSNSPRGWLRLDWPVLTPVEHSAGLIRAPVTSRVGKGRCNGDRLICRPSLVQSIIAMVVGPILTNVETRAKKTLFAKLQSLDFW